MTTRSKALLYRGTPEDGDVAVYNATTRKWEPQEPAEGGGSGASGPIYDMVFPWTFATPNIETTGAVIGQAQAGDIFLYGISRCSVLPDVAGGFLVNAGSSSGGDLLNGGTVSLSTIPALDIFSSPWTADGQRGVVEDDTDIVITFDGAGNAQGAGTFYGIFYRPTA